MSVGYHTKKSQKWAELSKDPRMARRIIDGIITRSKDQHKSFFETTKANATVEYTGKGDIISIDEENGTKYYTIKDLG